MTQFRDKKVIVVGGMGFIGSHVVSSLLGFDAEVHIIDNLAGGPVREFDKKITFHKKDISNFEEIKDIFKGAVYVFHLAALPRVQFSIEFPLKTFQVNVGGTLNVLEAAQQAGVSRVIYSASSSAYGDQPVMPLVEDMVARPKSPYALQKYEGELMCRMYSGVYGLPTVSLRYFNVYGPGMNPNGPYALVVAKFLEQRMQGKVMTITGDGKQTRDFTHVRDVARANMLAAVSESVGKGEIVNIGAGRNVSIAKIAELIGGEVEKIPARLEPKDTLADNSLAKKLLGWSPTVSIEEGIRELREMLKIN